MPDDARFRSDGVQGRSSLRSGVIDPLRSSRRCVEVESDIVWLTPQGLIGCSNESRRPDRDTAQQASSLDEPVKHRRNIAANSGLVAVGVIGLDEFLDRRPPCTHARG